MSYLEAIESDAKTIETLTSCRDHWKTAFEHERANVIRLRKEVFEWHTGSDVQFGGNPNCECRDCQLVRNPPGAPK